MGEGDLVDRDVPDVPVAGHVQASWAPARLDPRRRVGNVAEVPDLGAAAEREPPLMDGDPHRLVEVAEVGVDRAALVSQADQLPVW